MKMCLSALQSPAAWEALGVTLPGFDADLVAFNERTVLDTNGCDNPRVHPAGMPHALEDGAFVVGNGVMTGTGPGRAIREWPSRGGFRRAEPRRLVPKKVFRSAHFGLLDQGGMGC